MKKRRNISWSKKSILYPYKYKHTRLLSSVFSLIICINLLRYLGKTGHLNCTIVNGDKTYKLQPVIFNSELYTSATPWNNVNYT